MSESGTKKSRSPHPVGPEVYSRDYFLSYLVEGYEEYADHYGISPFKRTLVEMNDLRPGQLFLDVGCGRGEILLNAIERGVHGVGIDYSRDAIQLTRDGLKARNLNADLVIADAIHLPFRDGVFDRTYAGDLLEHLTESYGTACLLEMVCATKPGGEFLIHTCPNLNFDRYVAPLIKIFLYLVRRQEAWLRIKAHVECAGKVHVFTYNLPRLKKQLRQIRRHFKVDARCWLSTDLLRGGQHLHTREVARFPLLKNVLDFVGKTPLNRILSNDMYIGGIRL